MGGGRLLIASGADRAYFPLLRDMVLSIRAQRRDVALGVLDLGLDGEQREWLSSEVEHVVRPAWDLDFPGCANTADTFKAQVARPFLRRHFPGYEVYLWVDADAWLQDGRVIDLYMNAAGRDRLAITPEIDRAYKRHYKRPKLFGWTLAWKNYRRSVRLARRRSAGAQPDGQLRSIRIASRRAALGQLGGVSCRKCCSARNSFSSSRRR